MEREGKRERGGERERKRERMNEWQIWTIWPGFNQRQGKGLCPRENSFKAERGFKSKTEPEKSNSRPADCSSSQFPGQESNLKIS